MRADLVAAELASLPVAPVAAPPLPVVVELVTNDIACHLRMVGIDRRRKVARYDITVANKGARPVTGRFYGVGSNAGTLEYGLLAVASSSMGRSAFDVPLHELRTSRNLYLQVFGDGVHLFTEAKPPSIARRRAWPRVAIALLAAGATFLGTAAAAAVAFGRPAVNALVAPSDAPPGLVTATYSARGHATIAYRATVTDGAIIGAGQLAANDGKFSVVVPRDAAGRNVRIALEVAGPLGHDARSVDVRIAGAHGRLAVHRGAAQISALSAHRESYGGRSSIIVSYAAVGDGGRVRVIDTRGAVLASVPFVHYGTSRIPLARDVKDEPLRTELTVKRAGSQAFASVEIPAQGTAATPAVPAVSGAGASAPAEARPPETGSTVASGSDPFEVGGRVVSGRPFTVAIRRALPGMRLALQDEIGTTLDERSVGGASTVSLQAPKSSIIVTYYLVCTFSSQSSSEETLVRAVRIFPQ